MSEAPNYEGFIRDGVLSVCGAWDRAFREVSEDLSFSKEGWNGVHPPN
jgi:hypothetical protein